MTILTLLGTYWQVIVGGIAALIVAVFGLKYQHKKAQNIELKRENTALKAKEETAKTIQAVEQKKNETIEEVKNAPKNTLADRLNNLPK